jgi:hypothetical protein
MLIVGAVERRNAEIMDVECFVEGEAMLGCILRGGRNLAAE